MARDHIEIETTPHGESCAQVGPRDYMPEMRAQAQAFGAQLLRQFPPPGDAYISIKSNPHDFGSYLSLKLNFDDESEEETEWAYKIEGGTPEFWDEEARTFLAARGFSVNVSERESV